MSIIISCWLLFGVPAFITFMDSEYTIKLGISKLYDESIMNCICFSYESRYGFQNICWLSGPLRWWWILFFCRIYLLYFYPDGIVKYDGFSMPQIDKTTSKRLFIRLHKDTTQVYLDRLSWLHRLRHSQLYSTTIYHTLFSHSVSSFVYCLTLTPILAFSLSHSLTRLCCPCPLYIQKWCYISELSANRYISGWITSSRELPSVNSFSRSCLCSGHNIHSCASASLITRLWYMPPPIIPFFYTTLSFIFNA